MFLLSDYNYINFRRGRRKGSKNKLINKYQTNTTNHDKVIKILKASRETRSLINTALSTAKELRYWLK